MGVVLPGDIARIALRNGFVRDRDKLATAVAIAMAESRGNSDAVSKTNDVGLWQINLKAHPQYNAAQLKNVDENAKAMISISGNGTNWKPWVTYNRKLHIPFMVIAQASALAALNLPSVGDVANVVTEPIDQVKDGVQDTYNAVQQVNESLQAIGKLFTMITDEDFQMQAAKAYIGVVMVVVGLVVLNRDLIASTAGQAIDVAL